MVIDDWFERPGSKVLRIDGRRNRTSPKKIIKRSFFETREEALKVFPWGLKIDGNGAWEMLCNPKRGRCSTVRHGDEGDRREKRVLGYTGSICEE